MRNSWALLPCTRILFNKNKVSLADLQREWNKNTVYICERDRDNETGKPKLVFLASSGDLWEDVKVGAMRMGKHDQTRANLGPMYVRNIVRLVDGKVVSSDNDLYLDVKAPLMVFK